ncbi:MAG: hypothetical protein ACERKN_18630 [Velocimicrobium sp.]
MNLSTNMAPYSLVVIMILIAFTFDNTTIFWIRNSVFTYSSIYLLSAFGIYCSLCFIYFITFCIIV